MLLSAMSVGCGGATDEPQESIESDVVSEIDYYYADCKDVPGSSCAADRAAARETLAHARHGASEVRMTGTAAMK